MGRLIPLPGTPYRAVYDRLHENWCNEYCVKEFPECEDWADQWFDGREFTGDDVRLAVIEAFEVFEAAREIGIYEGTIRKGKVITYAGDGRILHVQLDEKLPRHKRSYRAEVRVEIEKAEDDEDPYFHEDGSL